MPHHPIPTTEPRRARQGDTWAWTRRVAGHPHTDGWSLRYHFAGPSTLTVTGDSGEEPDLYVITISASETDLLEPGGYRWIARVRRNDGVPSEIPRWLAISPADL